MDLSTITYDVRDGVAHLRFNRPEGANAVNPQFSRELRSVMLEIDLGAHRPGGMGERIGHLDMAEFGCSAPAERSPAAGEDQPLRRCGVTREALMQRAVLAVDRDELGAGH